MRINVEKLNQLGISVEYDRGDQVVEFYANEMDNEGFWNEVHRMISGRFPVMTRSDTDRVMDAMSNEIMKSLILKCTE